MDLEEMAQIIFVAHKEAASYIGFSRPKSILWRLFDTNPMSYACDMKYTYVI